MINIRPLEESPFIHIESRVNEAISQMESGALYIEVSGLGASDIIKFRASLYKKIKSNKIKTPIATRVRGGILYITVLN